jgi:hypothetical protein
MSDAPQKPRTKSRIPRLFRGESKSAPALLRNQHDPIPASDKERAIERYSKATALLEEALRPSDRNDKWGNFEIPKLEGEFEKVNPTEFKQKLESLCQVYSAKMHEKRNWIKKGAHVLECCYMAFSPFAKNFLSIGKEAAQVSPLS